MVFFIFHASVHVRAKCTAEQKRYDDEHLEYGWTNSWRSQAESRQALVFTEHIRIKLFLVYHIIEFLLGNLFDQR